MYLWVALKLKEDFANNVRQQCKTINKDVNVCVDALRLPAHISLKISFLIEDNDKQMHIENIINLIKRKLPLKVQTNKIVKFNNIIWVTYDDNKVLDDLHNELDEMLLSYGISKHEYDYEFKFHSTLFIDENIDKINEIYDKIKDIDVRKEEIIDTIIIGESYDGINFKETVSIKI